MGDWLTYAWERAVSKLVDGLFAARKLGTSILDAIFDFTVPRLFRALLIAVVVSFLAGALVAHAGSTTKVELEATATVWMFEGGFGTCSAVAVAPGVARTALHCAPLLASGKLRKNFSDVSYKPEAGYTAHPDGKDNITIKVPGLPCPCAEVTYELPKRGDTTYIVGHPGGGPLTLLLGMAQELYPYTPSLSEQMAGLATELYFAVTPEAYPGMSGGGVFVVRDVVGVDGTLTKKAYLFGVTSRAGATITLASTFGREPGKK